MTAAGQNIKRLLRHQGTGSPLQSMVSLASLLIPRLSRLFRPAGVNQLPLFALVA